MVVLCCQPLAKRIIGDRKLKDMPRGPKARGGPTIFARIGAMRALNRNVERVFIRSRTRQRLHLLNEMSTHFF
jgi:hypothetical protein